MTCYFPVHGYRAKDGSGKIVSSPAMGYVDLPAVRACGYCSGCRLKNSGEWAMRIVHEAQLHQHNSFVTLTYATEHMPDDWSLHYSHVQDFNKALKSAVRRRLGSAAANAIRFYCAGEYGDKFGRPHWHLIYFGLEVHDKRPVDKNVRGDIIYASDFLSKIWKRGFVSVGSVTYESAFYCARYTMKKIYGDMANDHYEFVVPSTGEIIWRNPEFSKMSLKPGIGKAWFDKFYHTDVYRHDMVVLNGRKLKPPRYYDGQYEIICPDDMARIKVARAKEALKYVDDNTPDRLAVRYAVHKARISRLKRGVDNDT